MSKKDSKLFDVRAIERNLRQGSINAADVQNYLDSLPDVSSKAVTLGEIEDARASELAAMPAPEPPPPKPPAPVVFSHEEAPAYPPSLAEPAGATSAEPPSITTTPDPIN